MALVLERTVRPPLDSLLRDYSAEVVARDRKTIAAAGTLLRPGSEASVTSLPTDTVDDLVAACASLRRAGLSPVPHLSARAIPNCAVLARTLERLAEEARVDRALVIGGDVDKPIGEFDSALQLIETGLLEANGIRRIALAVHPEGHPRVAEGVMWPALRAKIEAAAKRGIDTYLMTQFAFDARPYLDTARRLRAEGITRPLRIGVAGPAKRTALVKYALMCGVGASLRALRERQSLALTMASGETPEALLRDLAAAQADEPALGIEGVHFFTFSSLESTVKLADSLRAG